MIDRNDDMLETDWSLFKMNAIGWKPYYNAKVAF